MSTHTLTPGEQFGIFVLSLVLIILFIVVPIIVFVPRGTSVDQTLYNAVNSVVNSKDPFAHVPSNYLYLQNYTINYDKVARLSFVVSNLDACFHIADDDPSAQYVGILYTGNHTYQCITFSDPSVLMYTTTYQSSPAAIISGTPLQSISSPGTVISFEKKATNPTDAVFQSCLTTISPVVCNCVIELPDGTYVPGSVYNPNYQGRIYQKIGSRDTSDHTLHPMPYNS